jgi:hypothetical protein
MIQFYTKIQFPEFDLHDTKFVTSHYSKFSIKLLAM